MARTVEDAVRILEVIAGYDPADPITKACAGHVPDSYIAFLDKDGLRGARIGVFRKYTDTPKADPEIKTLFEKAIQDMRNLGAEIVDPFVIPDFDSLTKELWCDAFRHDVNAYLASLGGGAPYKTLRDIVDSGLYALYIEERLKEALAVDLPPEKQDPPRLDLYHDPQNIVFREAVLQAMRENRVDAFIYPTWSNPPRKVGDLKSPAGDNSQLIPPHTGLPGLSVPMGFTYGRLPAGLQIVGMLFGEPDIIQFAYAYEQATQHRRPPEKFPLLD